MATKEETLKEKRIPDCYGFWNGWRRCDKCPLSEECYDKTAW